MNIILISLFYFPEPVARPHDLAGMLSSLGHQVTVITGYPNYPCINNYPNRSRRLAKWEKIESIDVIRVPHFINRSHRAFLRSLSYLSFSLSAFYFGLLKTKKPDAIWTYQIGLPGLILSKLWHVPLIHEVQDLWPDWGTTANIGLMSSAFRLLELQEKLIYRCSQTMVTITEGFKAALINKGVNSKKIEIIPNWASESNFHPVEQNPSLANDEGFSGFFNVVYIGNIGSAQELGVVLEAAEQLLDRPKIQFTIIGDGIEREQLQKRAQTMGLQNLRFLGSRNQNEVAIYMALSDVLLIHLKNDPIFRITIPSKTYGYLASGRPILAAAEGELAELIKKYSAGVVCPPGNPMALASAVLKLYELPQEELKKMGQAGFQSVISDFSMAALGKRYSVIFEDTLRTFQEENT